MKKASFVILTLAAAASISFAADSAAPQKVTTAPQKGSVAPKVDNDSKVIKATTPIAKPASFDSFPEVIAEVDGKKLTKAEVIQKIMAMTGGKMPEGLTQQVLESVVKKMATQFVESTAILDAAIAAGFKPSPELAVKGFNDYLKTATPFQIEQLKKGLAQRGTTLEAFIEKKKNEKAFQEQMAINAFFEKNIISKCQVDEKEAKAYYDANPKAFEMPADDKDSMRASHILIMVKENADAKTKAAAKAKAEKLLALLKKDAKLFGELAEKESQCSSAKNKGSLGSFTKGQMVPEFEQAVVNLKTGEISGIVETKFGYHIIRRDALKKAEKKTFAEVKDKLQLALKQQKIETTLVAFIKKITDKAKGKVYIK
jgi:peptidyl-prolyl cis-trans isomerase C